MHQVKKVIRHVYMYVLGVSGEAVHLNVVGQVDWHDYKNNVSIMYYDLYI